jgi:hypothetical protein
MAADDQGSLREQIFPTGPVRDGHIIRPAMVESWESQLIGLGRLTAFVSPRLLTQSHAVDDAALGVVFLQRHRVEIALKLILERTGAEIPGTHKLASLSVAARRACVDAGVVDEWETFIGSQTEYIELMDTIDPDAATYRYPVDRSLAPWPREPYLDLLALEAAGVAFQEAIAGLVGRLAVQEPLPTTSDDAQMTVTELSELAHCCRTLVRVQDESLRAIREERNRLEAPAQAVGRHLRTREPSPEELAPSESLRISTLALAARVEGMVNRIVADDSVSVTRPAARAVADIDRFPSFLDVARTDWPAQRDAQIKWYVAALTDQMRALQSAVRSVEARTAGWSTPAARQIHLDVTRFRSRLINEAAGQPTG